jgi:putative restriction endonuclease
MKTSDQLKPRSVYTRKDLREKFEIGDSTINNGVFRPKDHESIWLFITHETKQYQNRLVEDDLFIDGQNQGRTDSALFNHELNGDEVLLFYRLRAREYPGGGFRYEGRFQYVNHTGTKPAQFHFRRAKE